MAILDELSSVVKRQRTDMGLSQERLADLAGLSRATINELETGRLTNLSLTRAERLANTLGFGLGVTGVRRTKSDGVTASALETAARSGSISYSETIPPETLRHTLTTGVIPPNYIPQLRALLDEAPLTVLSAAVAQIELENDVPRKATWQRMRQLATATACTRGIWS
ncbi:MAG: helix-turn-helix transcriptional regulator [Polaromonas sp.]|jgi:transcriptional regulator with XRE-family HTH domain|uniref:helix-turn-helix transcriptional regulator n=1 Tax=Polaromonas sp. TaxID=1869339 RepID=UPI002488E88E|nr:helix-turn-helix transcriptional regulator [Polaromonas sp.]MDI1268331.1 helix-turn-helix transcriptional regulator [Polaromonas sp.]